MAGEFNRYRGQAPKPDMNVVPLVDVMLVLLVIFLVTAPLLTHAVKIDLPKAASQVNVTRPEHIELAIRADAGLSWNGQSVSQQELLMRLQAAARLAPQPELHIRADRRVAYGAVAEVLAAAGRAGLTRLGFLTDPLVVPQGEL